jgi:hypothetical protein
MKSSEAGFGIPKHTMLPEQAARFDGISALLLSIISHSTKSKDVNWKILSRWNLSPELPYSFGNTLTMTVWLLSMHLIVPSKLGLISVTLSY